MSSSSKTCRCCGSEPARARGGQLSVAVRSVEVVVTRAPPGPGPTYLSAPACRRRSMPIASSNCPHTASGLRPYRRPATGPGGSPTSRDERPSPYAESARARSPAPPRARLSSPLPESSPTGCANSLSTAAACSRLGRTGADAAPTTPPAVCSSPTSPLSSPPPGAPSASTSRAPATGSGAAPSVNRPGRQGRLSVLGPGCRLWSPTSPSGPAASPPCPCRSGASSSTPPLRRGGLDVDRFQRGDVPVDGPPRVGTGRIPPPAGPPAA